MILIYKPDHLFPPPLPHSLTHIMQKSHNSGDIQMEAYRWLASSVTPRPIAWVSTLPGRGRDQSGAVQLLSGDQ